MSKQTRLPLDNRDVSRFFNNSVYNRSIKLWVNETCFTCSRLVLAQHSNIFEKHLRDSPPSVLLEDFHNVEGAENAIQDALILLYGGSVTVSVNNIKILSKFAIIYNIKELVKVCIDWTEHNLSIENVTMFFKALRTIDREGTVDVPDVVKKFMEEHTGQIVDYLLSSSDNIDDEFLLAMLELPSSSLLVQRCLKSGVLPDPIVDLIFKHSNTINVNFLLHDDKRTYVRLLTILKSKARSYQDMERIIDIQQKCISKMCHPYGSYDSLAAPLTPAPSIATISDKQAPPRQHKAIKHGYISEHRPAQEERRAPESQERAPPPSREYLPSSIGRQMTPHNQQPSTQYDEAEYLMPEELKYRQKKPSRETYEPASFRPYNVPEESTTSKSRPLLSYSERSRSYSREQREIPEKSFTSQSNRIPERSQSSAVSQLRHNLEKSFVPKYPEEPLNRHPEFHTKFDEHLKDNDYSDVEADHNDEFDTRIKRLSLEKENRALNNPTSLGMSNKTNYAKVYIKKSDLLINENTKISDHINSLAQHQAQNVMDQSNQISQALAKLAEQQAFIEHTYDNMSLASGRVPPREYGQPSNQSNSSHSGGVTRNTSLTGSRKRTDSSAKRNQIMAAESVTDFEGEIPSTRDLSESRYTERKPIHIPTTFNSTGSGRSAKPPIIPSNPPPNTESFFGSGVYEAKPPPIERPPPKLRVPPPPAPIENHLEEKEFDLLDIESMSAIDSGLPPECLPEHDLMSSLSPQQMLSPGPSRIMSPTMEHTGRSRSPFRVSPPLDYSKLTIPAPKAAPQQLSKQEILNQSSVLLNKRSKSRERERSKSKERKSMRKKKGKDTEKQRKNISVPMSFLDKESAGAATKKLEHPTLNRPKNANRQPPSRARPEAAPSTKPAPYHIKYISSNIPGKYTSTV